MCMGGTCYTRLGVHLELWAAISKLIFTLSQALGGMRATGCGCPGLVGKEESGSSKLPWGSRKSFQRRWQSS